MTQSGDDLATLRAFGESTFALTAYLHVTPGESEQVDVEETSAAPNPGDKNAPGGAPAAAPKAEVAGKP